MKNLIIKHARMIAISLLGLYFLLLGIGLSLEFVTGATAIFITEVGVTEFRLFPAIALTSWAVIGALLIARRPENPVGWIFYANALLFALDEFALGYAYYGYNVRPGSLPLVGAAIVWLYWSGTALTIFTGTLLFILFPTGRLLSPHWRFPVWICAGALSLYILLALIAPFPAFVSAYRYPTDLVGADPALRVLAEPLLWASLSVAILCALAALGSLILRLHRSRGVERQQIKWFVYAGSLLLPTLLLLFLSVIPGSPAPAWVFPLAVLVMTVFVTSLGVSSAFAILRYRLWDIDLLIRRTLIFGLLSVLLVLLYLGIVTLSQNLVSTVSGQRSPVVIVISTLIIAALFNPLRLRIQDFINRRFYRSAYNSEKILQDFTVTTRYEVDVDNLTQEILKVAVSTMQPETISLWLKTK